eukprot:TRINITY_DN2667_c0_g1_i1.p1 TRINITY_DN2667_c0_g1~~TRINITY_DN2667_c0_g1_i1.p1  ORF type:complete len:553 (+),score=169.77 TRINITY_DN2667_c0_g1_i1:66-1724(+)
MRRAAAVAVLVLIAGSCLLLRGGEDRDRPKVSRDGPKPAAVQAPVATAAPSQDSRHSFPATLQALCHIGVNWTNVSVIVPEQPCQGLHFVDYGPGSHAVSTEHVITRSATKPSLLHKYRRSIANVAAFCRWRSVVQVVGMWPLPRPPRSPNFVKIRTVQAALELTPSVRIVFHVDLDMWFTLKTFSSPPAEIGGAGAGLFPGWLPRDGWSVAVQDDYPLQNQNSGFFAVRRTNLSSQFLTDWWDSALDSCCIHPNLVDQECYHEVLLNMMHGRNGMRENITCEYRGVRDLGWKPPPSYKKLDGMGKDKYGTFFQTRWHHITGVRVEALTTYGAVYYSQARARGSARILYLADAMSDSEVGVEPLSTQDWGEVLFLPNRGGFEGKFVNGLAQDIDQYRDWRVRTPSLLYHSGGGRENWMFHSNIIYVPSEQTELPVPRLWAEQERKLLDFTCNRLHFCFATPKAIYEHAKTAAPDWRMEELSGTTSRKLLSQGRVRARSGAKYKPDKMKVSASTLAMARVKPPPVCHELRALMAELNAKRPYPGAFEEVAPPK